MEGDIKEIKNDIRLIKETINSEVPTFEAKIQDGGPNRNGKRRYFIYITAACKDLDLKKADKIKFKILKSDRVIKAPEEIKNSLPSADELEEDETDFIGKWLMSFGDKREYVENSAKTAFGPKRYETLLKLAKDKEKKNVVKK